ncbi:PREDICTED: probable glycosyltransferase At5g03795 [Tarenaya hassleriana]|uniref:probable glycosyltransferase At5g03795 n=1 Tax=Tarenaya hassleriana TaxID=28532 RepID=UPI00053C6C10|nr:PREDICTED: probable glycosyltransferase At5g03795 [Tarenaya hassleriana]
MDQTRVSRLLCRAETGRLVLLIVVAASAVLGLQYSGRPYRQFLNSFLVSTGNVSVSATNESSEAPENGTQKITGSAVSVHGAESNDDRVHPGNATFLVVQETLSASKPYNSTNVSQSLDQKPVNGSLRHVEDKEEAFGRNGGNDTESTQLFYRAKVPKDGKKQTRSFKKPPSKVISITRMKDMLQKRHSSQNSPAPRWESKVDKELESVKTQIKNAPLADDDALYPPLYNNLSLFKRSYELMEKTLKVYIYSEGDRPIFHQPEAMMDGIYASEGWFMKLMENSKRFVTKDPGKAHLFYIAFSSRILQQKLYVRESHRRRNMVQYLRNYVDLIRSKYPFWNRTDGSDHFFAACHDWAPAETRGPLLSCIRALCNADVGSDFVIGKDVSLPETKVSSPENPNDGVGGNRPSKRPILAFFAGSLHGYVRQILLDYWTSKPDPDMKILNRVDHKSYVRFMKRSRYCVCAKGYEVNSPRVVESVLYGCVPVIISDNFVPPFLEVLDWESFAVFVPEKEIPNLKKILSKIPKRKYVEMQRRVLMVQKHFMWHDHEPVRYDLFHMILHSVWYNRVFQTR